VVAVVRVVTVDDVGVVVDDDVSVDEVSVLVDVVVVDVVVVTLIEHSHTSSGCPLVSQLRCWYPA
jgi:hypothetical protein